MSSSKTGIWLSRCLKRQALNNNNGAVNEPFFHTLDQVLERDPENIKAFYRLALVCKEKEDFDEGLKYIQQGLDVRYSDGDGEDYIIILTYSYIYI